MGPVHTAPFFARLGRGWLSHGSALAVARTVPEQLVELLLAHRRAAVLGARFRLRGVLVQRQAQEPYPVSLRVGLLPLTVAARDRD
jgi:hypothetical protein